jgi:hypothetical protein
MILKEFYIALRDKILNNVTDIQHVKLFNEQFLNMEDQREESFPFPCVFVSYDEIEWESINKYIQTGTLTFTLKIAIEFYLDNDNHNESIDLYIFDLKNEVYKAVEGMSGSGTTGVYSNATRISEATDNNHDSYYVYEQTFTVRMDDASNCPNVIVIPAGQVKMHLNTDFRINNFVIRTGLLNG